LHSLYLGETALTDAGLTQLTQMRSLKHLYLTGSKVSADGVKLLQKGLPGCTVEGGPK
jgi:hypothetical protein